VSVAWPRTWRVESPLPGIRFDFRNITIQYYCVLFPYRSHPARGVFESDSAPTLVFTTACAKERKPWLANPQVHAALRAAWRRHVHWIVTQYVIMPDHLHFFAEPGEQPLPFDDWITVWKSGVTRILKRREWRWQAGSFHHRIRSYEDYNEKLNYMQVNPVKARLVERIEDWPYRGEMFQRYHWWP
jgi:REP-associated tyrosine transposase